MLTFRSCLFALPLLALAVAVSTAADEHPVVTLIKSKVKDPAKPFALVVTLKAKAGKEKDLEAAFAPCIAATKKEPGCLAYELNRELDDPTVYVMYERFKNVPAIAEHIQAAHTVKLLGAVGDLCEGPPAVKVYSLPE